MFQESLVESSPLLRTQNRWPVLISVAMQAAILTLAITIPLLHPEILPKQMLQRLDFLPSPRKPPAPPIPMAQPVRIQTVTATSAPAAPATQLPLITNTAAHPFTSDAPQVDNVILAVTSGPGHTTSPFSLTAAPTAPTVAPQPTAPPKLLSISEGVLAGNLVAPIRPIYPSIARAAGVHGTVVIQAIISKSGTIESAHVISGPAMLQTAAMEAVRSARYHPYLLNHEPTEVETTFSINFHLGSE